MWSRLSRCRSGRAINFTTLIHLIIHMLQTKNNNNRSCNLVKKVKLLSHDARRTAHGDGWRRHPVGHLSDLSDLKMYFKTVCPFTCSRWNFNCPLTGNYLHFSIVMNARHSLNRFNNCYSLSIKNPSVVIHFEGFFG